jgi:hypothetical protein
MDSSMYDFSIYCYEVSREGFFRDFKENVSDSDNIYSSVVMDFFTQRNVFIDELKSVIDLLNSQKFYTDPQTDNTDFFMSYFDEDDSVYNLDISYSNTFFDYDYYMQMNISTALLKSITRKPVRINYDFHESLGILNFNIFEFTY